MSFWLNVIQFCQCQVFTQTSEGFCGHVLAAGRPFGAVRCLLNKQNKKNQRTNFAMQVLLAKLKATNQFYAVKVLQKKVILKKKEVSA